MSAWSASTATTERAPSQTRHPGHLTAISCAPVLMANQAAALRCWHIAASRFGLTGFARRSGTLR
jgi:hypothetical protein